MLYILGKLSSSQCYASPYLTCNAAIYRFRDIRSQNLGFWAKGRFCVRESGTLIYHRAKFHADRCHRR